MELIVAIRLKLAVIILAVMRVLLQCFLNFLFYIPYMQSLNLFYPVMRFIQTETRLVTLSKDRSPTRTASLHILPVYTLGDGQLENMEYVAIDDREDVPKKVCYMSEHEEVKNHGNIKEENLAEPISMSSAEVLRSSITPLGMNNTLNIQRNESNSGTLATGMSSFMQNNNSDSVPLDRPLFVNTAMTAQQRIDIYRRLSGPPQDDEPALLFRWS